MTEHSAIHKIVVLGGGYAGTLAANRLRTRDDVEITLVNPRPRFVDRVRLHQLVAGTGAATVEYRTLLGAGIRLVTDTAIRIDTATRGVLLESGREVAYDYLIYAVGSTEGTPSVPGVAGYAYPLAEFESAQRLRVRLTELGPDAPVTVVGGGLTGIEMAAELAEQGRSVTLVCGGSLVTSFGAPGRRSIARWLSRHGVTVLEARSVSEVRQDTVVFTDGAELPSAVTIWATGFGAPGLAAASGLRTDEVGRLVTDETLVSVDDDRVIGAGDAAAPSGRALRMSSYAAGPLGAQAADTVTNLVAGTDPTRIDVGFSGACVSLGRNAGVRQLARKDDTAVGFYVGGRLGAVIKEATSRFGVARIRQESRKPGSVVWIRGGQRGVDPARGKVVSQ